MWKMRDSRLRAQLSKWVSAGRGFYKEGEGKQNKEIRGEAVDVLAVS